MVCNQAVTECSIFNVDIIQMLPPCAPRPRGQGGGRVGRGGGGVLLLGGGNKATGGCPLHYL